MIMRDPTSMSYEAERTLEWLNLVSATLCVGYSVFVWITSPRMIGSESFLAVGAAYLTGFVSFPLLLVTSAILLFTNRVRAMVGFAALLVAAMAMAHGTAVVR